MNDKLYELAVKAIDRYSSDCSVSPDETACGLRDLRDHITITLDGLKNDRKYDDR
jgi:hypothetical protein